MQTYPSTLPCVSRVEGYATSADAGAVHSPTEAGVAAQRRRWPTLPHALSLVFMVEQRDYAAWMAWVNAYAFDAWVLMLLPGLLASRAGADAVPTPVRFTSDVQAELVPVHRLWVWRCRVAAEWQPLAGDLAVVVMGDWIVADLAHPPPDTVIAGQAPTPSSPARVLAGTADAPNAWI
jgi:hypothetical protein